MGVRRKVTRTGAKPTRRQRKVVLTDEEKAKRKAEDERLAERLKNVVSYITTPAGTPPYDLEGDDYESIRDWVSKIKSTDNHSVQSCQYWVKYFYDPFQQKEQWRSVRKTIEDNFKDFGLPHFPPSTYKATAADKKNRIGWDDSEEE